MECIHVVDITKNAKKRFGELSGSCLGFLPFAYATLKVESISRLCSHELIQNTQFGFLQRSRYYINEEDTLLVSPDSIVKNKKAREIQKKTSEMQKETYKKLLAKDIFTEDAWFVLSAATVTEMYITGNFQLWRDFIQNGVQKGVQEDIKAVAKSVLHALHKECPSTFPLSLATPQLTTHNSQPH